MGRMPIIDIMHYADIHGFEDHSPGPCPVDPGTFVEVISATGDHDCERAADFCWEWDDGYPDDWPVAWRLQPS